MIWYSQSGQDEWVWNQCGQKKDGTFVDIGANDPVFHNNTYALELLGWRGVCVDIGSFDYSKRKSPFIKADATEIIPGLEKFLKSCEGRIDYLSLDADDDTFEAMERLIPFYKFKCLTVENDVYRVGPKIQNDIYDFLRAFGYKREVKDVLAPISEGMPWSGQPYEDFYVAT